MFKFETETTLIKKEIKLSNNTLARVYYLDGKFRDLTLWDSGGSGVALSRKEMIVLQQLLQAVLAEN